MKRTFLMRRVADGVRGCAEVMYPTNDFGAPDWETTDMVNRTVDYFEVLSPRMRRLLMTLFLAVEFGSPFFFAGLRRFSKLSRARRITVLRRWRRSRIPLFKLLADALKAQLGMLYMSHQSVMTYIKVYKSCERPSDHLEVGFRKDPFDPHTANGLKTEAT